MLKKLSPFLPFFAFLVLLPALSGPLLLDDAIHLAPIIESLSNRPNMPELIFGNASGPLGRPVSITSFLLNGLISGSQIWPMKLTNLALHLLTGMLLAKLFFRLFRRDANLTEHAKIASIAAASVWLVLPQHLSTVFYLIQRMTILATLFAVMACWLYVIARERMGAGEKNGFLFLAAAVVMAALSALSKENGLLVPLYCLLIECIFFDPGIDGRRPKIITWGFRLGVIYPFLCALAYLAFNPGYVLAGYVDRSFSMPERVMTQIPVLGDYFASTFIPMVRSAGVFNDDFPVSTAMGPNEITILAIGICLIISAIAARKNSPVFSAGIGIFFIGHLLESSIFPLELYFSHRNYLPSIGIVMAVSGLLAAIFRHHIVAASIKQILPIAFIGIFLVYGMASFNRAILWSNNSSLLDHAQLHHPTSSRLRSELFLAALETGRTELALQQADMAMKTSTASEKRGIQLWRILAYCYAKQPIAGKEVEALHAMPADRITLATSTALGYVSAAAEVNSCPGLDTRGLGLLANDWAINTVQSPNVLMVWQTHLSSAKLLAASSDYKAAFLQAKWAFVDSGYYSFDAGLMALQLTSNLEDTGNRKLMLDLLIQHKEKFSEKQRTQLQELKTYFERNRD